MSERAQAESVLSCLDEKAAAEIDRILEVAGHEQGKWKLCGTPQDDFAAYCNTSNPYLLKGCFRVCQIPSGEWAAMLKTSAPRIAAWLLLIDAMVACD